MKLTVAIWSAPDEKPSNFVDLTSKEQSLKFSTLAMGGFGDASFTIPVSGWNAVRWYRSYLGFHIVIFDHLGRRVYEGSIEDAEAGADGVNITCLGYFSHAKELTHGMIYLAGDLVTASQVIEDPIDIAYNTQQLWSSDTSMIQKLSITIGEQDFTQGKKLSVSGPERLARQAAADRERHAAHPLSIAAAANRRRSHGRSFGTSTLVIQIKLRATRCADWNIRARRSFDGEKAAAGAVAGSIKE